MNLRGLNINDSASFQLKAIKNLEFSTISQIDGLELRVRIKPGSGITTDWSKAVQSKRPIESGFKDRLISFRLTRKSRLEISSDLEIPDKVNLESILEF